jgi:hypothetical protein
MTVLDGRDACLLGECVSSFGWQGECALIFDRCCARHMVAQLAKAGREGCLFPLDLRPGGNPFVNGLVNAGLARTDKHRGGGRTFATGGRQG